jgi:hypothetical protein
VHNLDRLDRALPFLLPRRLRHLDRLHRLYHCRLAGGGCR